MLASTACLPAWLAPGNYGPAVSEDGAMWLQPAGKVLIASGPYMESKEHIGGFGCWKPLTWTDATLPPRARV